MDDTVTKPKPKFLQGREYAEDGITMNKRPKSRATGAPDTIYLIRFKRKTLTGEPSTSSFCPWSYRNKRPDPADYDTLEVREYRVVDNG